ncbi:MAG: PorV/PorQ family protein [Chitinophagales bacterium]
MQKFISSLLFIFTLANLNFQNAVSQEIRKYSNEFLNLGVGGRALGMGNAQTAATNDIYAAYWNPAGLVFVNTPQVAAMHAEWFAGISKYDYLSVALPIAEKQVIGLSAIRMGVDDVPNTLYLLSPDGSVNYDNVTTFSVADYAFLASYAQKIKRLRIGGNVKIIHRRAGKFATAWGFGLDLGLQYQPNKNLTLGLTVKDLTTTPNLWSFNFTEEEQEVLGGEIPVSSVELTGQRAILGVAYRLQFSQKISLLTTVDLDMTFDGKRNVLVKTDFMSIDPHIGMELEYNNLVFLRAGLNNIQEFTDDTEENTFTSFQPNVGIGLKIKDLNIDYAFTGLNRLSDGLYSHVISLRYSFKKKAQE